MPRRNPPHGGSVPARRTDPRGVTLNGVRSLALTAALLLTAVPGVAHSESDGGASGSVAVVATVRGVHLVVLDDTGEISEIWSNVPSPGDGDVVVRAGTVSGPELRASAALIEQYQAIAATIDWSRGLGLVWRRAD